MGQEIRLSIQNQSLSEVLIQLNKDHGLEFSFNSTLVSHCRITVNGSFKNLDEVVEAVTIPCGIQVIKSNDIYILKNDQKNFENDKVNVLVGKVYDRTSGEALPYAQLKINGTQVVTNLNGVFTYRSTSSFCHIFTRHIGFYAHDTTVGSQGEIEIVLQPVFATLKEVVVHPEEGKNAYNYQEPFTLKANNQTAVLYPGSSDNILFNMLRLQAGVLAAGEQTKDYIVQGSYRGQTQVVFEGITLFGTGTYNEHIGVVNPLIIKDIEIRKSGYSVHEGDRVGGVVCLSSLNGNPERAALNLRLNNQTLSSFASTPLGKRNTLSLAGRGTFYHLYKGIGWYNDVNNHRFNDFNVKFTSRLQDNLLLSITGIRIQEGFELTFGEKKQKDQFFKANRLNQGRQSGLGLCLTKTGTKGGITSLNLSHSSYYTQDSITVVTRDRLQTNTRHQNIMNGIELFSGKLQYHLPVLKRHQVLSSFTCVYASSLDSHQNSRIRNQGRIGLAISDRYSLTDKLVLRVDLRADLVNLSKPYWQPRALLSYSLSQKLKIYGATGIYRQFYANDAFIDERRNFIFKWVVYDGDRIAVSKSKQAALGSSYEMGNVQFKAEGFYKETEGLNRWVFVPPLNRVRHFTGKSTALGLDLAFTRALKKIEYGCNYTLSKTLEHFDYFLSDAYRPAPQNQLHELKTHVVAYLGPVILSANYVFGSGLYVDERINNYPYKRFDLAGMYRFKSRDDKWLLETGLSVLNLFNTRNLRPNYFISYQEDNFDIPTGVPFTPTIFLNIRL